MDEPPLPEVVDPPAPPPAHAIQVHGAQLVRVVNIDDPDPRKRGGFTTALFLAWARIPDSDDWAVLTVWLGARQTGARTTGGGRHAWLRLAPDDIACGRVRPVKPDVMDEDEWHGHHPLSEFSIAVRAAAATLPAQLREQAVRPRPAQPAEPQDPSGPRPEPTRSDAE